MTTTKMVLPTTTRTRPSSPRSSGIHARWMAKGAGMLVTAVLFQVVFLLLVHTAPLGVPPLAPSSLSSSTKSSSFNQTNILHQNNSNTHSHSHSRSHRIPPILIFTHYLPLLQDPPDPTWSDEEIALSNNLHNIIALHPQAQVRFLTDPDCIQSLQQTFPALIPYFEREKQGMFKADICRGSALLETGGYYLDVDVGVRRELWSYLLPSTEFVTTLVHSQSKYPHHFFQAILGAAPNSPVLQDYLQLFYNYYSGAPLPKNITGGPLGVLLLRQAWDRVYNPKTDQPPTELYQEVLYQPKMFPHLVPTPTWGTRRACHFVVVAPVHDHKDHDVVVEMTWKHKQFHVPFYSRIEGSRMCPAKAG